MSCLRTRRVLRHVESCVPTLGLLGRDGSGGITLRNCPGGFDSCRGPLDAGERFARRNEESAGAHLMRETANDDL